jgi:hypothetical protein
MLIFTIMFVASCSTPNIPNISYFPVQKEPGLPSLMALESGKLLLEDGCLRSEWFGTSHLLIWPYGYTYRVSGNSVEVLNDKGEVAARTGQFKQFGGGEVPSIEPYTETTPAKNYAGPYWLVGNVENWYVWYLPKPVYLAAASALLLAGIIIVWLIIRRKSWRSR